MKFFFTNLVLFLLVLGGSAQAQYQEESVTEYENSYYQVRKSRKLNSDGRWTSTSYKYVFDYPNDPIYKAMTDLNMISTVVEETVAIEEYVSGILDASKTKVLAITTTNYSSYWGLYLPSSITKKLGNGPVNTLVTFKKYDSNGNLLEYEGKDKLTNTFTYYDQNSGKANLVASHKNYLNQTSYYDYIPLVGLKTVQDINGKTITYNYDSFGRLQKVADHVGQLKEYSYHFVNQPVINPISATPVIVPPSCPTCTGISDSTVACVSPTPTLNASLITLTSGQSSTITATGCSGTIKWWDGTTGTSKTVNSGGVYTATCTNSGCSESNLASVAIATKTNALLVHNVNNLNNAAVTQATGNFSISSTDNWTITNIPSWITLSTTSGVAGTTLVTATVQANKVLPRSVVLTVSGTNVSNQYVTISQVGTCGSGLTAQYYPNSSLQGYPSNIITQPEINMGGEAWAPISGTNLLANNIGARWEGFVEAPVTGTYQFNMRTDDGTRVWFDGVQRVNDWADYPPKDHFFTVSLVEGQKYPIKIEWKQFGAGFEAKLSWSINGQAAQIIPTCRLYSKQSPMPTLVATPTYINISTGQNSTIEVKGCNGTITWDDGLVTTNKTRIVTTPKTYTAYCTEIGASSSAISAVTVYDATLNSGISGNFNGYLDGASCDLIYGWAFDANDYGKTLKVGIYIDDILYAIVDAKDYRADVGSVFNNAAAAWHGFNYTVPQSSILRNGAIHTVRAKIIGIGTELNNSGRTVQGCSCYASQPALASTMTTMLAGQNATLTVSGLDSYDKLTWENSSTNTPRVVNAPGTYTATITKQGCVTRSNSITINDANCNSLTWSSANNYSTNYYGYAIINVWVNGLGTNQGVEFSSDGVNWYPANMGDNGYQFYTYDAYTCVYFWARPTCNRSNVIESFVCTGYIGDNVRKGVDMSINATAQTANIAAEIPDLECKVAPNPTNGEFKLIFFLKDAQDVTIAVNDIQGKEVWKETKQSPRGVNAQNINLSEYPSGTYIVTIGYGSKKNVLKIVKL